MHSMEQRLLKAGAVYSQLYHIWKSKILSIRLKLRVYCAAVVSIAMYGCEGWILDQKAMDRLAAWNCRKLVGFSGFGFREEYQAPEVDLVGLVRLRRLRYVEHLLKAPEDYLPRRVAVAELEAFPTVGREGGLFMDVPRFEKLDISALVWCVLTKERWEWWVDRIGYKWRSALVRKHECRRIDNSNTLGI